MEMIESCARCTGLTQRDWPCWCDSWRSTLRWTRSSGRISRSTECHSIWVRAAMPSTFSGLCWLRLA